MNRYWFLALFSLLAIITFNFEQDRKIQCDGNTKIFASLGKTFPCNNYTGESK